MGGTGALELAQDVAVIFFGAAAKEFERYDEQDDADAGAGKHAAGCDVP